MAIFSIPVVKGKGTVSVDTELVPENYYKAALESGFKTLVNGGATKITIATADKENPEKLAAYHAAAMAKAQERVEAMLAGTLKLGRATAAASGPSGEITIEARRLARDCIKQVLRDNSLKVSHYSSSEITKKANELLSSEAGPGLFSMAEANIAKRKEKPTISATILSGMHADPALVAKAEEKKLKTKAAGLSKTQAGRVAGRASHAVH